MSFLTDFFESAEEGLGHILIEALPEDVIVTFELEGPDGGVWSVRRFGPSVSVRQGRFLHWDCRLVATAADFEELLLGHLSSREGFRNGRLRIEGDVGLVLRLERAVLRRKQARS